MTFSPRVLIIDEDQDSRVETRRAVQRGGMQVAGEVGFGTEGVTFANETAPDCIVLAVEEPVTRALETAEALASVLPQTPLIFYSSLREPEAVRRSALYGARDYLLKPLQSGTLKPSITRALQFEERKHLRLSGALRETEVRGTVVTIAGAKGGIGKSVVAVNLALALRIQTDNRVAILDADTHFGDVATMLDLTPSITLSDLIDDLAEQNRHSINRYLTGEPNGVMVLASPPGEDDAWGRAGPNAVKRIVELLAMNYDFVVVDTSGAMDAFVREAVDVSTLILLVTTGEVSSVRDTKGALARLNAWGTPEEKIKLLLNRGARAEGFQSADLEKSLARKVFWELPRDKNVSLGIQVGEPVVLSKPGSAAAKSIFELASTIGGNVRSREASSSSGFRLFRNRSKEAEEVAIR